MNTSASTHDCRDVAGQLIKVWKRAAVRSRRGGFAQLFVLCTMCWLASFVAEAQVERPGSATAPRSRPGTTQVKPKPTSPKTTARIAPRAAGEVLQYLPIVCLDARSPGVSLDTPCKSEKYDIPKATELVRHCPLPSCTWSEMRYDQYGVLDDNQKIDVCTTAIPRGTVVPNPWSADADYCKAWTLANKIQIPVEDYFTVAPMSGKSPLTVLLKWKVSNVSTCFASEGWQGTKGLSGEESVTLTQTTSFKLACNSEIEANAVLGWEPPTVNEDGSQLTNLAGYRIIYGQDEATLTNIIEIPNPAAVGYDVRELKPGTWYFAVKAYNTVNAESATSNVVNKALSGVPGKSYQQSVSVTVSGGGGKPKPPTKLTVTEATALLYEDGHVETTTVANTSTGQSVDVRTHCTAAGEWRCVATAQ